MNPRLIGSAVGNAFRLANPERRSATRDAVQSLAIGVAVIVPLALFFRRRIAEAADQSARDSLARALPTQGLEVAPRLYRMRY